MTIIYLNHPTHGNKVATMEMEAEFDEQNGWVRYTDETPSKEEMIAVPVNTLEVKRRRKTIE
jgi:hypothetical protein